LKLSQSTIELLYRFFPHSIDVLKFETSLIYGEAPVVLECGSRKNAIVTIFGNPGHDSGKIVGFGAEQVILVRDDYARKEILDYVGKQALVLTILECKGLEFQVVKKPSCLIHFVLNVLFIYFNGHLYYFAGCTAVQLFWHITFEKSMEVDL
jgi:hypothetical protein